MRRTSQWAKVALLVGLVVMLSGGLVLAGALPASAAKRAVMISPYGTGTPFDALAYSGLQDAARDFGLEVTLIEATDLSEYETQLVAAAEMGYDIILALHDYFAEPMIEVAQMYPDTTFILVDSAITAGLPNMLSVVMEPQEGCYLAGIAAAYATKTKHVGFVGGNENPHVLQAIEEARERIKRGEIVVPRTTDTR